MTYQYDAAEIRDLARDSARSYNEELRAVPPMGSCHQHDYRPDGRGLVCRCGDAVSAGEIHE